MGQIETFQFFKTEKVDIDRLEKIKSGKFNKKIDRSERPYLIIDLPKSGGKLEITVDGKDVDVSFYDRVDPIRMREIIDVIKEIYLMIGVGGYGYNEYDGGDEEFEGYPSGTELGEVSRIWSVNLFTPEEVEKYGGKEKLLKSPVEFVEGWEDGAIFMMLDKNFFSSNYGRRKKLREYLENE